MLSETQALQNGGGQRQKPSERVARFILGIFCWVRDIITSPTTSIPRGWVFQHHGRIPAAGNTVRYSHILLVEDNPNTAREIIKAIEKYYIFGTVRISIAHVYEAAVVFFDENDIDLVIMDADLDDEKGDGTSLTRRFFEARPEITILANSSSRISNLKLTGFGACETMGKSTEKLIRWLAANDPAGSGG